MPTWWQSLIDALVQLLRELKVPLGIIGAYHGGVANERRKNEAAIARAEADALRRAMAVPDASRLRDDELDAELDRRGLLRMAGVQTNRSE